MVQKNTDESASGIEQYTWNGDTWYGVDGECPECGEEMLGSNGTVKKCYECNWWKKV